MESVLPSSFECLPVFWLSGLVWGFMPALEAESCQVSFAILGLVLGGVFLIYAIGGNKLLERVFPILEENGKRQKWGLTHFWSKPDLGKLEEIGSGLHA